jgi:tetratricopeptide (TPR) repeat protein
MRLLEGEIEARAPSRLEALPLLNVVLDLDIPENDFTKNLEPRLRQSALHALLEDCLKEAATDEPLLIVIEDLHWIDALSHDLLEGLAKALENQRVCFVLAYRPPQLERLQVPRLEDLRQFTRIQLHELTEVEAEGAIRAKLAQLYPARGSALPAGLMDVLMARSQGNPFYLEELLNYVRDRGLDPADFKRIELPESLYTLILSRIDQLSEQEKTTLRVASIVGRLFRASWLMGYYPELGEFSQVKAALDALDSLDITPLDSPEPELTYLFKHIVTHEVTYESLPVATRARLHEQLAVYLESAGAPLDMIAQQYGRSNNTSKKLEYFQKAAEAEQRMYANGDAIRDYRRAIALLQEPGYASPSTAARLYERLGDVLHWTGQYEEARESYIQAAAGLPSSEWIDQARLQRKTGNGWRDEHFYQEALQVYRAAKDALDLVAMRESAAWWQEWIQVLLEIGLVYYWLGWLSKGDELRLTLEPAVEQHASPAQRAAYLQNKRWMEFRRNRAVATPEMISLSRATLAIHQEIGNQAAIPAAQFGLGFALLWHGDTEQAIAPLREALQLAEATGDISLQARCLSYLSIAYRQCGQMEETRRYAERTLEAAALAHMPEYTAMAKANQAWLAWRRDNLILSQTLAEAALEAWGQLPGGHASAPFQWLACFPLIAAALQQEKVHLAIEGARTLLDPILQRLPDELAGTLERAVQAWDGNEPGVAQDLLRRLVALAGQMHYL